MDQRSPESHRAILVADLLGRLPGEAMWRAIACARDARLPLHILLAGARLDPGIPDDELRGAVEWRVHALDKILSWARHLVPEEVAWSVHFASNPIDVAVIEHVAGSPTELVILPPFIGRSSQLVRRIATRAEVPVLVARERRHGPRRKHVALHVIHDETAEEGRASLASALATLKHDFVIDELIRQNADLVVIGERCGSRTRGGEPDLYQQILTRARASILVFPVAQTEMARRRSA